MPLTPEIFTKLDIKEINFEIDKLSDSYVYCLRYEYEHSTVEGPKNYRLRLTITQEVVTNKLLEKIFSKGDPEKNLEKYWSEPLPKNHISFKEIVEKKLNENFVDFIEKRKAQIRITTDDFPESYKD